MGFEKLDEVLKISLLNDFYGALLTIRQQEIMELYHDQNLSINEIANELGVTKQGVHEALKKSEGLLYSYEEKLGLIDKFLNTVEKLNLVKDKIDLLDISKEKKKEILDIIKTIEE